jgi:AraC-like DNA-binding protein
MSAHTEFCSRADPRASSYASGLARLDFVETDRPGERMAVNLPAPGVRVFSVTGSDRHCTELHEVHTLCVLHAGQPRIAAEWRSGRALGLETAAGDVMVMELGEVHRTTRVHGKASYSVVQLAPQRVAQASEQLGLGAARVRARSLSHPELRAAVMGFVDAAGEAEPFDVECRLSELIRVWLGLCGEERLRSDAVLHRGIRRARDALRERASYAAGARECPRLEEVAALSGLSVARFPHAFKQWLGMSPYAYFNVSRLNGARSMLERGASATEVAAAFGFADAAHFSRRFRGQFGLAPGAWSKLSRRTFL